MYNSTSIPKKILQQAQITNFKQCISNSGKQSLQLTTPLFLVLSYFLVPSSLSSQFIPPILSPIPPSVHPVLCLPAAISNIYPNHS